MEELRRLPEPGELLAGKYEVVRLLGHGGMGVVYEALHAKLRQRVAVKILKPELAKDPSNLERFAREGQAAARLTTPHVARVFDVETTPSGLPFMVMELLEGRDLAAELHARIKLPVAEAVDVVLEACSAIAEAHAMGVIHRDLKPGNIFLVGPPSQRSVKVLDFGVSKLFASDEHLAQMTTPSLALGTPQYMSPEQIVAAKNVDTRSDIWSLGIILYKAITGRLPFEGDSPTALVVSIATHEPAPLSRYAEVPEELSSSVMRALAKAREDRFPTVEDFARAIEPFGSGRAPFSPAPSSARLRAGTGEPRRDESEPTVLDGRIAGSEAATVEADYDGALREALRESASRAAASPPTLAVSEATSQASSERSLGARGAWVQHSPDRARPVSAKPPRKRGVLALVAAGLVGVVVTAGLLLGVRALGGDRVPAAAPAPPPALASTPPPVASSSSPASPPPPPPPPSEVAPSPPPKPARSQAPTTKPRATSSAPPRPVDAPAKKDPLHL